MVLVYFFVQFGVTALALSRGGRYERNIALLLLLGGMIFQFVQKALTGPPRAIALLAVDIGMLASIVRLFWHQRTPWLGAVAVILGLGSILDLIYFLLLPAPPDRTAFSQFIWWVNGVLTYLQLAVLAFAVLRREVGPPYQLRVRRSQAIDPKLMPPPLNRAQQQH